MTVWAPIYCGPQTTNWSFQLVPLFPQEKHHGKISSFSCPVGDYTSKLQLYRDRKDHPSNPLPPSCHHPFRYLSFLRASSLYCTMHATAAGPMLGFVCDLCLTVLTCKERTEKVPAALTKPTRNDVLHGKKPHLCLCRFNHAGCQVWRSLN